MGFRTNWKEHEEKKMESLGQLEERGRERETLRQKVKSEKHIYIYIYIEREREREMYLVNGIDLVVFQSSVVWW